jgi:hypothetical protein
MKRVKIFLVLFLWNIYLHLFIYYPEGKYNKIYEFLLAFTLVWDGSKIKVGVLKLFNTKTTLNKYWTCMFLLNKVQIKLFIFQPENSEKKRKKKNINSDK